jgi:hypothetical protein
VTATSTADKTTIAHPLSTPTIVLSRVGRDARHVEIGNAFDPVYALPLTFCRRQLFF